jgi:pyruvate/2-oxoglutarate dehydrogenase complex dihydrolipoamide acyltransferase (E2) component
MPFWYFFPVPQIPSEVAHQSNQVELIKYRAKEGSKVVKGMPIALVENWWAVFQLSANGPGIPKKTFFDPGTSITVGDPIAIIGADAEAVPYAQSYAVLEIVKMKRERNLHGKGLPVRSDSRGHIPRTPASSTGRCNTF